MPTVNRVLPWRRSSAPASVETAPLLSAFRARHPKTSTALISRAYERSAEAHTGQMRKTGESYIHHPLSVARIVAGLGLDDVTIAAALLHDAVEDTGVTLADIDTEFGSEVARIVDGVTKLDRVEFGSKEEQQAASMRKMLVAVAKDLRVLIIKLADRLHNMRTLGGMPEAAQMRIAQETLDVYGPLAHRLGMQDLKQQLEDLAFATLHPKQYAEIDHMVSVRAPERELYLEQVLEQVRERLAELNVAAEVTGRPKHLWSIYEKMVLKTREFDDIYDLVGIRVLVESVKDCYAALGSIHATWRPVQGRFKDYVAMPKFNLYQSLHTTVIGPQGKPLEVQLRTREMHQRAEFGVAAHWAYKDRVPGEDLAWLSRIVDWEQETSDPAQFMETLKVDLEQDEVFIFTPKGKVISLARGATPIDFAYTIHTEVGHACVGARVNGRLVSLNHQLVSGDTCEIITSKVEGTGPSRDWLNIATTPRAANKIRQWFSRERREDARENGREDLIKQLRREGLPVQKLPTSVVSEVATSLNYVDVDALHTAIGEHHVSAESVVAKIDKLLRGGDPEREEQLSTTIRSPRRPSAKPGASVHVEGLDDVMVRLSRCCTPVPGDEIIGFVTRGRGVSVHRADCANAGSLQTDQADRVIEVEWDEELGGVFVASIEVRALDRPRLLRDVSSTIADHHVNILQCSMRTGSDRIAAMRFEFELGDPSHLTAVLGTIRAIDGVYDAYRVVPGHAAVAEKAV
ncbi:MAG: bifunctional (p)ppGpp synthetase/guanosine-3',5'-bis(diphosphate) 3'-pyrophosphohydrolase [Actinomycetota bacterium]|nr:bifunctional (p)ppGpp synthetase/guanosine-3',5'-bis(diphosphate) 3'-pyrophosphohydrolase [Actinomycetota bacterium]